MDNLLTALILSVIEGLTEFLPVSSTGHLILAGDLLGFTGPAAATFEVVIQLGAILAVVVLYWRRFMGLLKKGPGFAGFRGIWLLLLTTLPACVFGLPLHSFIKTWLFNTRSVLCALIVGAICMLVVSWRHRPPVCASLDCITPKTALAIGFFQCLALWPGFSRSAATIMGGIIFGVERGTAAEYSFIAAVPIMVAATGYDLLKSLRLFTSADIPFFAIGIVCSFISALLAVKVFVSLLASVTLAPFAVYRLLLACLFFFFAVS